MESGRRPCSRLVVSGVLLAVLVTLLFGFGWRLEWDTNSGKERRIQTVWGVGLFMSKPKATVLSEWRDYQGSGSHWVKVASDPPREPS